MANYLISLSKQERGYGTDPYSPAYFILYSSDRNGDIDESTLNPDIHINTNDSLSFLFDPDAGDNFPSIHPVEFSHSDAYEWDVNNQNVTTTTWYGTHNGETNNPYVYGSYNATTYHYAGEYYYRSKNDPSNVVGRIIVSEPSSSSSSESSSSSSETTTTSETITTTPPVVDYSDCVPGRLLVNFSELATIDSITALGYNYEAAFNTTPLTGGLFTFDANSKTVATAIAEVQAVSGVTYAECDTTVTTTTTTPPAEDPVENVPAEPVAMPSTTMTLPALIGATEINVVDSSIFVIGDTIIIGPGTAIAETHVILSFGSIILTEPLAENHPAGTVVEKVEVVDCSTIPQNCRTTIDELTDATTSEDTDEFIVSRGGEAFKVSTYEIISKLLSDNRLAEKIAEIVQSSNTNTNTSNTTQTASIGGYIDVNSPGTTAFGASTPYRHSRGDSVTFPDFDNDTQVILISYTIGEYNNNFSDTAFGQLQPLQVGGNAFNVVPGRNLTATLTAEGLLTVQANSEAQSTEWMAYRFTRATL